MKKQHNAHRRIVTVVLSLSLIMTCLPFLTDTAYAETTLPKPDYNGVFEVHSTYFVYSPFSAGGGNNPYIWTRFYSPKVYMEYSKDGKHWKRTGYMQCESVKGPLAAKYRIGGLRPNTAYRTRIYFGDDSGNRISPYRRTIAIKTGRKKRPSIRSVTARAVNVRFHRTYKPGYYYWTGYHYVWIKGTVMEYYTYDVKVTVKLRKKPGTNGIWVNGRWLKGNKKSYSTTFKIPSPHNMTVNHPRGNIKYTVKVQSGQSRRYGGYSPAWTRTLFLR